jgi:hypothetical protein
MRKPTGSSELPLTRGVTSVVLLALCCTRNKRQPFIFINLQEQNRDTGCTQSRYTVFRREFILNHCRVTTYLWDKSYNRKLIFQGMHRSLAKQDKLADGPPCVFCI